MERPSQGWVLLHAWATSRVAHRSGAHEAHGAAPTRARTTRADHPLTRIAAQANKDSNEATAAKEQKPTCRSERTLNKKRLCGLTLELSGRCWPPHDSTATRRSGPLERIVRHQCAWRHTTPFGENSKPSRLLEVSAMHWAIRRRKWAVSQRASVQCGAVQTTHKEI